MQKLRDVHIEPLTYVSFYGLRNNGELNEQPVIIILILYQFREIRFHSFPTLLI